MRIGLFGGSFNPPHAGHIHASDIALKYLGLDAVWWLVSPGNPLKPKAGLPDSDTRSSWCRDIVKNPRIVISTIERDLKTTRTYDTVTALQKNFPHTDFIWFAGTDIAYEFSRWYKWQALAQTIPFAFVGRPTNHGVVRHSPFHQLNNLTHHNLSKGGNVPLEKGHIYWIFAEPLNPLSSTMLRNNRENICHSLPKAVE